MSEENKNLMGQVQQSQLPIQQQLVKPACTIEEADGLWNMYQELEKKVLKPEDYQRIGNKKFKKKSACRKLATFFNISDEVVSKERVEEKNGSFTWRFHVRATAPNGRITVAVGACNSKERGFSHVDHDVFATAHTRAKNRALLDLVGWGDVSAEEIIDERQSSKNEISILDLKRLLIAFRDSLAMNIEAIESVAGKPLEKLGKKDLAELRRYYAEKTKPKDEEMKEADAEVKDEKPKKKKGRKTSSKDITLFENKELIEEIGELRKKVDNDMYQEMLSVFCPDAELVDQPKENLEKLIGTMKEVIDKNG